MVYAKLSKKIWLTAPLLLASCVQGQALRSDGSAIVVFFTPGGHWRGMGEKLNPFALKSKTTSMGVVYEREHPIVRLTHSRFVVLMLKPGSHTFGAGRLEHVPKESVTVSLEPGSITYFAVTTTAPSVLAGYAVAEKSHLEVVPCTLFAQDHSGSKSEPAERSQVAESYRGALDEVTDATYCKP